MIAMRRLPLPAFVLAALALAGCGSGSSSGTSGTSGSSAAGSRIVHVTLSDAGCSPT